MFPQGVDTETALAGIGILPNAEIEVLPCEVLLVVLSLLGIFAAALVELLNQGWFVPKAPLALSQLDSATKLEHLAHRNILEEPPVVSSCVPKARLAPKEGLAPASEVRAVVKNTFLHFEEDEDKPPSPLSRSMPIGAFNHALKAELLQQTTQPRSPCRAAPTAVATVIEEEPLSPQMPQATAPVDQPATAPAEQLHRPRHKHRTPRSARKKRLNLRPGLHWEPCVEPEVFSALPRTPIAGGGTPRSSTSSATPLCLEVLVPESCPRSMENPPRKVQPRIRHRLSLVKELDHSFKVHEPRVIEPRIVEPVWGQFLD
eukprot:gnl/MRDRNA2_/MRDRNA2_131384_c0_seq1.p1 gnl/MRDRNA2_/MRDRNA2_131384_c0~~gnl/MRDRNA2_/MRDRNA2_131384_c0_seq1.p1  ORF type:complete len:316 (-),score=54.84 gnl/MRDRNA2_/MRDRNA2_131384_c0_seq1:83-1030(-)